MQAAIRGIEPKRRWRHTRTLAEVASESVQITRLVLWLLATFAATALVLAAVGIYGVMSYVVGQRAREIGTRIALGAQPADILLLVLRQGALIAGVGHGGRARRSDWWRRGRCGPFSSASRRPIRSSSPGAAVALVATALVACYLPARRAVAMDPARTLTDQ